MASTRRIAAFFIVLAAIYYCWNSYVLPVRGDEAYIYLKSIGLSWTTLANTGLIEYILKGMDYFGSSSLQLRLPSIIFISLSAVIIYQLTLKISDIYGAWFSLVLFFVSPSVTYANMSMTPNALFIFCTSLYIYAFYMTVLEKDTSLKYYIMLALSMICAVSVDFSGIMLLINHIVYGFIKKDSFKSSSYAAVTIITIISVIVLGMMHYFGVFDLFYKYPVHSSNQLLYKILLIMFIYLPVLFVFYTAVKHKIKDNIVLPLLTACIIFGISGIISSIVTEYDVRYFGAVIIPALILSGYFYEIYGYKIVIGAITAVLVLVSVYTNINSKSPLTPSYMENTRVYESLRLSLQDLIVPGDCIFTDEPELSSILSYNTILYPEACTLDECAGSYGIFVSKTQEAGLEKYFSEVKESSIYRLRSIRDGDVQLYFYKVSGLKQNKENN